MTLVAVFVPLIASVRASYSAKRRVAQLHAFLSYAAHTVGSVLFWQKFGSILMEPATDKCVFSPPSLCNRVPFSYRFY